MKPEEMTNEELIINACNGYVFALGKEAVDAPEIIESDETSGELLRRLNERDALHKENEELRKDKDRMNWLASCDGCIDVTIHGKQVIGCFDISIRPVIDRQLIHESAKQKEAISD